MKTATNRRITRIVGIALFFLAIPSLAFAQDDGFDLSRSIRRSGAHQISGFVTLGLATTVSALGLFGSELHPVFGWGLVGTSTVTLALGSIAYRDRLADIWLHPVLAVLATTGFVMNALEVFPYGSQEHVITGIASTSLLFGSYLAILLMTR